jgi:Ankyrin repeats (3 copies)/Ankyrin repeat
MDSLTDKLNPKAIKTALQMLPKGSGALDTTYGEVIKRIESQAQGLVELAKRVLSWIACSKRQLNTAELQYALAVEEGESELDAENITETEDIISVCAGLVTIDQESDTIRLAHKTTQQYLERILKDWVPLAETDIAKTCLTYLMFQEFANGVCLDDEAFEARLQKNVLLDYASKNWWKHAQNSSDEIVKPIALQFLRHDGMVLNAGQFMQVGPYRYKGYSQNVPVMVNGIHLTAYLGLKDMLEILLNISDQIKDFNADAKDQYGQTPLLNAAENGHTAIVELLAARDDVNADAKDRYGQTPLLYAAQNGHTAIVKLLAARDDVNADAKDRYGRTPLLWAAAGGHAVVVELLLARDDVNADAKDGNGRTPLSWAAAGGHAVVIELLLARDDVNADTKDGNGWTPLSWAATRGHTAVVELLLAWDDVNADAKDDGGRTPLSWAAKVLKG